MIAIQANGFEVDLSIYGLQLNEESNFFVDNMIKSYTFPFSVAYADDIMAKLGLPNLQDITDYETNLNVILIIDDTYYDAQVKIGEVEGDDVELTLYYGDEVLPIYGTDLKNLPWPIHIITNTQLVASQYLNSEWPQVTHNFPKIFAPNITEDSDYGVTDSNGKKISDFFKNNYNGTDFVQNVTEVGESGETIYVNKNVLCPCPYMLEILSFIFKTAGKKISGDVFKDERLKKIIYHPQNFIEKFKGSLYTNFQFSLPNTDINSVINGVQKRIGVYQRTFTPDTVGTYNIKFNINLDSLIANYFSLKIYQDNEVNNEQIELYSAVSSGSSVNVNENLSVNINNASEYFPIIVELQLLYNTNTIALSNSFEFSFSNVRLNEYLGGYTLGEFMPKMTAGEYVNAIKNWLNLDVIFDEEYVYINFLEDTLTDLPIYNHTHLEVSRPRKVNNQNRVFKLKYIDDSEVIIDKTGRIFSDLEKEETDIIEIPLEVKMLDVENNFNSITAISYETDDLSFVLYNGLVGGSNNCIDKINLFTGKVDNVYELFWKNWLSIRTNNFTFIDKFKAHQHEKLLLRSKIYKYNQLQIPVSIYKTRQSQEYWDIELKSETF
ncbi:hypothetical protein M1M27_gp10 [Cellulophaga phage Ingeline_1]|uniref:Uncharacterized protein n=1 Tax=Cellulophaga phage Ingeline_1 TaxID=2745674 RepID=A0A8E4ZEN8_9CAUD|nr:hypothetical protein M1M27_gp10 [Cellulophaga phage Ingeline_1]QQV90030.1 hypothetical protein Ingeline2_41 [Cellulophaga phage Ingeline_2]QQV90080.1 hypothetical protein Ingeline3_41 [Cellulophaga phage Ingeline_3]QQV90130.1 hypothetical protein Ingeline4_41 [Cellulophaga phage Ingeline_4]QQV90179.1 hypothetical protein Ingeline5_40 [Cellulophaga phage Ingeline_5]QQV90229.1 hypothetical protein Ingeline6_41 [Cellulophaga phage Ingeline_6]QQV90279.1 hypothetical protein Ingeline7_41 [Cellu